MTESLAELLAAFLVATSLENPKAEIVVENFAGGYVVTVCEEIAPPIDECRKVVFGTPPEFVWRENE